MDLLTHNVAQSLMVLGVLALIIEAALLGFSTFFLLFVGLAMVLSGLAMSVGLLDPSWFTALWSVAISSAVFAALLWKPLKRMQNSKTSTDIHSDFADICFTLNADLNEKSRYQYSYSGINWQVKSVAPISQGTVVKVVKKEVGTFWVEAAKLGGNNPDCQGHKG